VRTYAVQCAGSYGLTGGTTLQMGAPLLIGQASANANPLPLQIQGVFAGTPCMPWSDGAGQAGCLELAK
jgi:hypothetical protein